MPTATRRASCARRRNALHVRAGKRRWTSSPYALNMDPVELRRVNDTQKRSGRPGGPIRAASLMQCFDAGARSVRLARPRRRSRARCATATGSSAGAAPTACYPTQIAPAPARVAIRLPDGRARVQTAAHEIGTGAYTVIGHGRRRAARPADGQGDGRARRHRAAAGAGRGRIEHDRQRLTIRRRQGLRRHPRAARRRQRRRPTAPCRGGRRADFALVGRAGASPATGRAAGERMQRARPGRRRGLCRKHPARPRTAGRDGEALQGPGPMLAGGPKDLTRSPSPRRAIRRGAGACADRRDPRAAHRRRLRGGPDHERADRAQPAHGRHDLGRRRRRCSRRPRSTRAPRATSTRISPNI